LRATASRAATADSDEASAAPMVAGSIIPRPAFEAVFFPLTLCVCVCLVLRDRGQALHALVAVAVLAAFFVVRREHVLVSALC
jgi:hypothetical protein